MHGGCRGGSDDAERPVGGEQGLLLRLLRRRGSRSGGGDGGRFGRRRQSRRRLFRLALPRDYHLDGCRVYSSRAERVERMPPAIGNRVARWRSDASEALKEEVEVRRVSRAFVFFVNVALIFSPTTGASERSNLALSALKTWPPSSSSARSARPISGSVSIPHCPFVPLSGRERRKREQPSFSSLIDFADFSKEHHRFSMTISLFFLHFELTPSPFHRSIYESNQSQSTYLSRISIPAHLW